MCFRFNDDVTVTEEDVRRYAALSGDYNPIHTKPSYAHKQGFEAPIAHGILTMGLITRVASYFIDNKKYISEYEMRFLKPIYINETLQINIHVNETGNTIHLKICHEKLTGFLSLIE